MPENTVFMRVSRDLVDLKQKIYRRWIMELSNLDKLRQAVEFINGLTGKKLEMSGMDVRQGLAVKCLHCIG